MESMTPVYLGAPGLYCTAGSSPAALWQAMLGGTAPPRAIPGLGDVWPRRQAFIVDEPPLERFGIDRKLLRTMEKQARLAVFGAGLSLEPMSGPSRDVGRRFGLYLGLPTINEEMPPMPALDQLSAWPDAAGLGALFLRETPPFSGLALLNSSACAHISATFGLTGAMAAFSPANDAGLQALIEAALSVAEGENDCALAGAVSPKVHPLLLLQQEKLHGKQAGCPGEAAAFLVLRREAGESGAVRLAGYHRAHAISENHRGYVLEAAIHRAIWMADLSTRDIDWILIDGAASRTHPLAQTAALERCFEKPSDQLPVCCVEKAIGATGPAEPLVHVLLALHGLAVGRRLCSGNGGDGGDGGDGVGWREENASPQHALVIACGMYGQVAVVVLSREAA